MGMTRTSGKGKRGEAVRRMPRTTSRMVRKLEREAKWMMQSELPADDAAAGRIAALDLVRLDCSCGRLLSREL